MKYLILVFIFSSTCLFAQTTVNYFPWQSLLGITKQFKYNIALDYKIETNSFFNNMNMEVGVRRTKVFIKKIDHADYLEVWKQATLNYGLGIAFNPTNPFANINIVNGYYLDLGARWDFEISKNVFYFILDCSPYVNKAFTNGNLRTRLGLGYRISKK